MEPLVITRVAGEVVPIIGFEVWQIGALHCRSFFEFDDEWVDQIFFPAIERNHGLETLIIQFFPTPLMTSDSYFSLFKRLLDPLRSLTTLYLAMRYGIEHKAFVYVAGFSKQLQRLHLTFASIIFDGETDEQYRIDTLGIKPTQLKQFELDFTLPPMVELHLIPILEASPELETLLIPTFESASTERIASVLGQCCPKSRDLVHYQMGSKLTDGDIAEIIGSCRASGLRSFCMTSGRHAAGLQVMRRLCANYATLVKIRVDLEGLEPFKFVQELLASCPNLRRLHVEERVPGNTTGRFAVREILRKPWVCTNLESFSIPLAGIYGIIEGEENESQGKDYHRDLYTQLAKLARLQELSVGFLLCYERMCKTSPRFSLKSGLEILEGLKELRSLTLHYMVNDTQRQELEWMCEHWSKLTRIDGINLEIAESWWDFERDQTGKKVTLMPKRIREMLIKGEVPYHGPNKYDFDSDELY
ncbi:hypothetical protein BGZ80_011206 [Entomortierella chlamydospora]|uniref:F-box domain protein n=1 Tax=Entomortierella chlamydospora TaxID=101097 RepID=A0A9P6MTR7_9FUNG|nr:hypothetical protein BGZ80_011206 [Entomortierella chlamydospora]